MNKESEFGQNDVEKRKNRKKKTGWKQKIKYAGTFSRYAPLFV